MNTASSVPASVIRVLQALEARGFQGYLVGGCVRDVLLSRPVHDYDVATNARPDEVMAVFERTVPTGLKHGTVTVLTEDIPVEVTTYRVDLAYSDGRRPDAVRFTEHLEADLARRDFTMNAIAMDLHGQIIDPYEGQADLSARRVRAVGNPVARFREDGLRILRALRFAAQLSFQIETETECGMAAESDRLKAVSNERIGQEWKRMAESNWWNIVPILSRGAYLSVLPYPLPRLQLGFNRLHGTLDNFPQLPSVWERRMHDLSRSYPNLPVKFMAAVGLWMYAANAFDLGRQCARSLAWRSEWGRDIDGIVQCMQTFSRGMDPRMWRHTLYHHATHVVEMACALSDMEYQAEAGSNGIREAFMRAREIQPLNNMGDLGVTGYDLLAIGLTGEEIGRMKQRLAMAVLDGEVNNETDALIAFALTKVGSNLQGSAREETQ